MVAEVICNNRVDIVYLEETKLTYPIHRLLKIIGPNSPFSFQYKNARGALRGTIIGFNNKFDLIDI